MSLIDYTTTTGQVRLLIADTATDPDNWIFSDAQISGFLTLARSGNVRRAAALALRTMAANEVMVQKRIRINDLSTDGPAEAAALRALAGDLEAQAETDEVTGAFDWAEQINTPAQYDERWVKERLRDQ